MSVSLNLKQVTYPQFYESNYILTYPTFNEELRKIIDKSGLKENFKRNYRKKLKFLEGLKVRCTEQNSFEQLTNTGTYLIWSIKIKDKLNVRILFTFEILDEVEHAILLYPFVEKNSNNKGKNNYTTSITMAKKRIDELK